MLYHQKLIYRMIDSCNNYQKLYKINKGINTIIKIVQNNTLSSIPTIIKKLISNDRENNIFKTNIKSTSEENSNDDHVEDYKLKNIKRTIKLQFKILMSIIAHKMDPVQRAGETTESNKRDAKRFGRSLVKCLKFTTLTTMILKMILNQIKPILETSITSTNSIENQSTTNMNDKTHVSNIASCTNSQQTRFR